MSEVRFDGRVAIVTGAGRGLGREYALLLAARGAKVVVNDLGCSVHGTGADAEPARVTADEINSAGGVAVANVANIVDRAGAASIVRAALDSFGRVDIVINNAGIVRLMPFEGYPDDLRDLHIDVHLRGSWNVTQEAWTHMRARGYGRVLMIVSSAGIFGQPNSPAYCAVKGAVVGLTRALALEGAPHGIAVNALGPGAATRMQGEVDDPKWRDWAERHLKPAFAAPAACWLVHEECPVTGRVFAAHAGRMASYFTAEAAGFAVKPDQFTLETVRDNWDKIAALEPFVVPDSTADAMVRLNELLGKKKPDKVDLGKTFGSKSS